MSQKLVNPPQPSGDLRAWARAMTEWLRNENMLRRVNDPQPVLLAQYRTGAGTLTNPRATVDGLLLFEPAAGEIVHSVGGEYVAVINGNVVRRGTGSPEGVVTAPPGTLYLNDAGGAGTTLYVKESGAGNTGWVGK